MQRPPIKLENARILVTNDDGIDAPGLKVLEKIARSFSKDVWVVAPATEQSGAGHSLTLTTPLRLRKYNSKRYALGGSPTDCVLFAVAHLMKDTPPDIVLSGVNRGANVGDDVTYSGTVAAAMEATIIGLPAIALSQERDSDTAISWDAVAAHAPDILKKLVSMKWPRDVFMNVNFPNVPPEKVRGVHIVPQGRQEAGYDIRELVDPRGNTYYWIGQAIRNSVTKGKNDYDAIAEGGISITPLHMDLTHRGALRDLRKAFS